MNTNSQFQSPNPQSAVVLASGGMDSCVTAAVAARERELAMLHISYGQRTENRELKAFNDIADFYKAERRMTASIAHLLSIATSWAEVIGADRIYIGAVAEDSSGYPDCRPEYYEAFQRAIDLGTKPETRIEIVTPVIRLRKSEIVKLGAELGAPLELSWSCYKREDVACGECDSCALRLRGFREAGLHDPIPYAIEI